MKEQQQKLLDRVVALTLWLESTTLHTRFIHCLVRQLLSTRSSDSVCITMHSWHIYSLASHKMRHPALLIQPQAYASLSCTNYLCKNRQQGRQWHACTIPSVSSLFYLPLARLCLRNCCKFCLPNAFEQPGLLSVASSCFLSASTGANELFILSCTPAFELSACIPD